MKLMFGLFLSLLAVLPVQAEDIGSCVVGKVSELKEIENLAGRATYLAGNGSGVFISSSGRILTNHHVIDGADEVVAVHGGTAYRMKVVKRNKEKDLAILEFDGLPYEIGASVDFEKFKKPVFPNAVARQGEIKIGEQVTVVGFPAVYAQGIEAKVTRGIISSRTGFKGNKDNFQMDAAVFGGNSGGPVFDAEGELLGLTVASCRLGENANYAIRMEVIKEFCDNGLSCGVRNRSGLAASVERMVESAVLILVYKVGARPCDIETKSLRAGNEAKAKVEKTILHAKLLQVRKEWKELREITDGLMASQCADDDVVRMNERAREELGVQLVVYAEVEGADVKARIKPICGIRDSFVQCEEAFALEGDGVKRGFPVKAELSYHTPQGALWKGILDEIYDWRGTKEIRIKLEKVTIKED